MALIGQINTEYEDFFMTMDIRTTNDPVEQPLRLFLGEDLSGLTADIPAGTGLVYDYSYVSTTPGELATDPCGKRANRVVRVGTTNASTDFAGVLAHAVKKDVAATGGKWVYVYGPGSFCNIYVNTDVTQGARLACSKNAATKGQFVAASATPEQGNGAAVALQSRTGAGVVLGRLFAGNECGLKA
jgi:hypothetical protein